MDFIIQAAQVLLSVLTILVQFTHVLQATGVRETPKLSVRWERIRVCTVKPHQQLVFKLQKVITLALPHLQLTSTRLVLQVCTV